MSTKNTPNHTPWYKTRRGVTSILGGFVLVGAFGAVVLEDEESTQTSTEAQATVEVEDVQVGNETIDHEFTQWWLGRFEATSWDQVSQEYSDRWEGNVVSTAVTRSEGDSLVIVTNLSRDNSIGQSRAENAVVQIQNVSSMVTEDEVPLSVSDNLKYVTIFDLRGDVLARGSIEFPNVN